MPRGREGEWRNQAASRNQGEGRSEVSGREM